MRKFYIRIFNVYCNEEYVIFADEDSSEQKLALEEAIVKECDKLCKEFGTFSDIESFKYKFVDTLDTSIVEWNEELEDKFGKNLPILFDGRKYKAKHNGQE